MDSMFADTLENTGLLASLDRLDPGLSSSTGHPKLSDCISLLPASKGHGCGTGSTRRSGRLRPTPPAVSVPAPGPAAHGSTLFGDDTLLQLVSADDLADNRLPRSPSAAAETTMMPPPPVPYTSSRAAKRASRGGANSSRGGSNASRTSRPAAKPARGRRRRVTDRSRLMTTLEFTAVGDTSGASGAALEGRVAPATSTDTSGAVLDRTAERTTAGDVTSAAVGHTVANETVGCLLESFAADDAAGTSEGRTECGTDGEKSGEERQRTEADTLLLSRDDSLWTMSGLGAAIDEVEDAAAAGEANLATTSQTSQPAAGGSVRSDASHRGDVSHRDDVNDITRTSRGGQRTSEVNRSSVAVGSRHGGVSVITSASRGHQRTHNSGASTLPVAVRSPTKDANPSPGGGEEQVVTGGSPSPRSVITEWGLPDCIAQNYINAGLSHLYSWQAECLRTGDVLNGGNLVYSAPTSSGKTLVAEILLLRRVVSQKRKAIVVVPFVSLAREKTLYLQSVCDGSGVRVDGFFGSQAPPGGLQKVDVAICTIEKANNLVNRLMEDGCLHRVGCVVADELHLLGDPRRGYLLEVLLTKLLYMNRRLDSSERRVQLVAMSATLPNLGGLAGWLSAALYVTEFRPVPLQQFAKLGGTVYDERLRPVRAVDAALGSGSDPDLVLELVLETVTAGHGVLVFCPTKAWCEQLAVNVAAEFCRLGQ